MSQLPDPLRRLASVVAARLLPDGTVVDANAAFADLAAGRPNAAELFIQPTFAHLAGAPDYEGLLNLGEPGSTPTCFRGTVTHSAGELLVVAEHDPAEWRHLHQSVLDLNGELAQTQRQLVRDVQARRRAEAQERQARQAAEEANRGILALYAELDDKAQALRQASEMKSRFLSNMTHEFRTPLNAILSLSRMALEEGELGPDAARQVALIRQSAEGLSALVNDLLDLAKIEAGRTPVRLARFRANDLFAGLRGTLRPLVPKDSPVALVFEEPAGVPEMHTDEGKVAQVLRNFVSNALKFTERGEVRVSARPEPGGEAGDAVVFSVADTGVGVAAEDQARIFEEYAQVDGPLQRRARGTGLGLPLSRRLAELLGGAVWLDSRPGAGSTFFARIPVRYPGEPVGAIAGASQ